MIPGKSETVMVGKTVGPEELSSLKGIADRSGCSRYFWGVRISHLQTRFLQAESILHGCFQPFRTSRLPAASRVKRLLEPRAPTPPVCGGLKVGCPPRREGGQEEKVLGERIRETFIHF